MAREVHSHDLGGHQRWPLTVHFLEINEIQRSVCLLTFYLIDSFWYLNSGRYIMLLYWRGNTTTLGLLPFLLGRALPCHGGNYLANKPLFIWPYRQIPTISTEYVVFLVPDVVSMGICLHFFFLFFVFPRHISGSQMAENVEPNYTLSDTT